ncbi:voltage-dependent T-type calcium channel subunit alpha-1H-like [Stegodyphus dumicola]|uniref:voltage-dependent T-type calcium channel subunit alpha-1H-like n=1 Tax=Stegodyphus dumicola TaxID=202533 RepID=UPI0015B04716|nr:voltage-dependent T-type calcium channel subunit alpha-1H-like [Stegodyphus dumicola]
MCRNKTINEKQYGFCAGRSTDNALKQLLDNIEQNKDINLDTLGISLDIKGTFDSLWWLDIVECLDIIKCPKEILNLIRSYLQDRWIQVTTDNYALKLKLERCSLKRNPGVPKKEPQGSCLGPTLWNLVRNTAFALYDQQQGVGIQAYADDFLLVISGSTDIRLKAQNAINTFASWELVYALKVFNYFFTAVFILEAAMKIVALGLRRYLSDRWNQLDVGIVILSVIGIVLEEMESEVIPINPTIIRVMRVLRIARVLKLLKMAKGIRALLDTVMQALPQVGNLGLLFFLLFFIFAALGVELFGRLECTDEYPCQGLGEHAHFRNFGMAFLTLFRVATGDNWNGIMKDTLRENCDPSSDCIRNCCVSPIIAPLYFVVFVLMAQFVLVNVVVAVLMKHLEESHKHMDDDIEIDAEIERQLAAELADSVRRKGRDRRREARKQEELKENAHRKLIKMSSLPANFIFRFSEESDAKNTSFLDRTSSAQYSPLATISIHEDNGTSPTLSWPVASTSDNRGRRHTLEAGDSEDKPSVSQLSPTPLVGSVISLCSSGLSDGGSYRSPMKGKKTTGQQVVKSKYVGPPIRMISAESSDDASAPSTTVIPVDDDDDDENQACASIVIQEVTSPLEDELSICDVLLSDEDEEKEGVEEDNGLLWYVEEEESATSTNGLLRNYPELRSQPGLDTVSWTASDDFSSTTISGTLSGAEAAPEDGGGQEPESTNIQQPSSSSQCISVSQSSSLRMLGLDEVEEEEEMEDVLVVDPNDQKAVLIIGTRRCSGMPVTGDDNIGHCITKPPDQC